MALHTAGVDAHGPAALQRPATGRPPGSARSVDESPRQLAQRRQIQAALGPTSSVQAQAPIQRAIKGERTFANGILSIDMEPGHRLDSGESYGEEGLIRFEPNAQGPRADVIELVQTVAVTGKGKDVQWTEEEAIREVWKAGDKRFVDQKGEGASIRGYASQGPVSPAYNASIRREKGENVAGAERHKDKGKYRTVNVEPGHRTERSAKPVELWDHPSATEPRSYSFETGVLAQVGDQQADWGSVRWSFRTVLKPPSSSTGSPTWSVADENLSFDEKPSENHVAAVRRFDEVMGNTGLISPESINAARDLFSDPKSREKGRAAIQAITSKVREYQAKLPVGKDGAAWHGRLDEIAKGLATHIANIEAPTSPKDDLWANSTSSLPQIPSNGDTRDEADEQVEVPDSWEDIDLEAVEELKI
ncbi:hypothetical protein AACH06_02685 [Ideonella sp. DXS29W]|uniref:Uncharacterized protein n=1 Tax=Ideonella lacteola TaxID=2984193 RepID=A0ABU9BLA3_9BURK